MYDATASTELGLRYVQENKVKYVCRNTWGLFFSDLWRDDCHFAKDVEVTVEQARWREVDPFLARLLGLRPVFTWWDRFGCWVAVPLGLLLCLIGLAIVAKIFHG